ncbi:MAG: cyclodeaminase/cyclohydrolase family protein [Candidatus Thermoplasmatota archaeon]|jgi:formiminotetrahydrofolate cyclodeaminase|nr:cyclodeaminase/cyclohydrolase family protein [Candidatus Thermoplasmatota archaeon]
MDLNNFMERLASKEPAPGGGAASALVAMVGSALSSMVSALTDGKKGYEHVQERVNAIELKMLEIRKNLEDLMQEDEQAFNKISSTWKLPKSTDEEKMARKKALQSALRDAIEPPWRIANLASDVMDNALDLLSIGNKNAITDSACSLIFAFSAAEGALLNITINVNLIDDTSFRTEQEKRMKAFYADLVRKRDDGMKILNSSIHTSFL